MQQYQIGVARVSSSADRPGLNCPIEIRRQLYLENNIHALQFWYVEGIVVFTGFSGCNEHE